MYHDAGVGVAEAVNGIVNYTLCVATLQHKVTNEWEGGGMLVLGAGGAGGVGWVLWLLGW